MSESVPPSVDVSVPNAARMYDYMLGGSSNFAVDREAADAMIRASGSSVAPARLNRSFLRRAVRFMVDAGIDQFLDLGSGIPTVGNVHEIAQAVNPDARVVYVDNEPVAVTHAGHLLAGNQNTVMIEADLRAPDVVLGHPDTVRMLDFDRPIGLLMVAIFHFIPDDAGPGELVHRYRAALAPGSCLALSHYSANGLARARRGADVYNRTSTPVVERDWTSIEALFDGFELVEPGLVWTSEWRPDGSDPELRSPSLSRIYAGVGVLDPDEPTAAG